jgi:hypothetical protein
MHVNLSSAIRAWCWLERYGYYGKVGFGAEQQNPVSSLSATLAQRVKVLAPASYSVAAACVFCSFSQFPNLGKLFPNPSVNLFSHSDDYFISLTLVGSSDTPEYSFLSLFFS